MTKIEWPPTPEYLKPVIEELKQLGWDYEHDLPLWMGGLERRKGESRIDYLNRKKKVEELEDEIWRLKRENGYEHKPVIISTSSFCQFKRKQYKLLDENGKEYISNEPGTLGGNSKLKIYGHLDCPSVFCNPTRSRYAQYRVFFKDEKTAIAAGYRPCYVCMREAYMRWKEKQNTEDR